MAKECGFYTAKYLLCFLNFILFVISTIVLAIGVWLIVDKASLISLFKLANAENVNQFTQPELIQTMGYILAGLGVIVFVISFFGYCGAMRDSRCLLITYCISLILLLCAQLAVLGYVFIEKDKIQNDSRNFLQQTISRYYSGEPRSDGVTYLWNEMMTTFQCCGVNDYEDFKQSPKWEALKGNRTMPEACCVLKDVAAIIPRDEDCVTTPNEHNSYFRSGCYEAFNTWLVNHREVYIGTLLAINAVNIIAIFLGFCLYTSAKRIHRLRL